MHFSVMVFGDNVERQLAPFQETNMGPIAPEYMEKVDYTDEVHELFQARRQYFRLSDGRYVELWPSSSPRRFWQDGPDPRSDCGGV